MNCSGRNVYLCAAGLLILVESFAALMGSPMPPRIIQEKEFSVVGIEARTNNAKESTGDGIIPKQWSKFFAEGILSKIPNKVDPTIYAVYTDYASDRNGDYTFLIGAKISAARRHPRRNGRQKSAGGKVRRHYQHDRSSSERGAAGVATNLGIGRQKATGWRSILQIRL